MRWIYSFLYSIVFILALPYFVIVGLLKGKYLSAVGQRFAIGIPRTGRPSIWIHAVSVGEYLAAKELIRRLQAQIPDVPIFVSTTTKTGQQLAKESFPGSTFYFPFDWSWCIKRVLRNLQPRLILVLETEIWPNFLWEAKKQHVPVLLINGRISDRSFRRYSWIRNWLPSFDQYLMQTKEDAQRVQELGAPKESVSVMGNLKFDFQPPVLSGSLRQFVENWKEEDLLWINGSTMKGEDQILIQIFQNLSRRYPLKMMIAPRHPERFQEVIELVKQNHLTVSRRSSGETSKARVMILDTIGELAGCYELADVVFIGGTLGAYGGHNPIEPAFFGKPIVAGPHYDNFRSVFDLLKEKGAILISSHPEIELERLIRDSALRSRIGEAAKSLVIENKGAIDIVLQKAGEYLNAGSSLEPHPQLSLR